MDFSAFSHGQIQSKLWLCEHLDKLINKDSYVVILGSWYNILGFMLQTRKPGHYLEICGIDIDNEATNIAEKINEAWTLGPTPIFRHLCEDANSANLNGYDVIINCSAEHMDNDEWYDKIPRGKLVCIQSTNLDIVEDPWKIVNPVKSIEQLVAKYPMKPLFYSGTLNFDYKNNGYSRYMIIGCKY
jgi:hypothetical protein